MRNYLYLITVLFLNIQANAINCISGDCANGYGIQVNDNNNRYLGEFKNGKKYGQGVFYYSDDIKYVGSWKDDARHGEGRMYGNEKVTQAGVWKNNKLVTPKTNTGCLNGNCENGVGTFLYEDGRKLFGQFENGKAVNEIICYYPNGQKYIGKWENDKRAGIGIYYKSDGEIEEGMWGSDQFIGATRSEQGGCIAGDCNKGEGTYIYPDKTRYNGSFDNSLANGFGICYYSDGDIYIGEWKNHTFNGEGTMYYNNGSMIEGKWLNGVFQTNETSENIEVYYDLAYDETTVVESKIWVVLVGVARYTTMQSLKYTDDDAFKMHSFFKSPEGGALPDEQIKILIDEDATKDGILSALTTFAGKVGKQDLIIFFFSGHGIEGSFLPYDYDGRDQVLKHKEVLSIMEGSNAKSKVVIADACHSGSFAEKGQSYETTVNALYNAFNNSRGGTLLLLSSKAEETSIESNGFRQGVFSHYLINGLKGKANANNDGIINVQEIYEYVHANVRNFTNNRQSPVIRGNFDGNMPLASIQK